MQCAKLVNYGDRMCPCGQCLPCRINKQRGWTGRILLEADYSPQQSTFLTLSYNDDHLPENGSVNRQDPYEFRNRLRKHIDGEAGVRFFSISEYGDKSDRPHYHMALFSIPPEQYEKAFAKCWTDKDGEPLGFIKAGLIEPASAGYIAQYTTKKMTGITDERLQGREPEYAAMSRRPPLGAAGINHILTLLKTRTGQNAIKKHGDIPPSYSTHGKTYPIGIYWRDWLRNQLGITDPPDHTKDWALDPDLFELQQHDAAIKAANIKRKYKRRAKPAQSTGRTL